MQIDHLLSHDRIACGQSATSKKRVLEAAAALLAGADPSLEPTAVFESLIGRERLGSTGLGHGIALPHGRMPYKGQPIGALITLKDGVDFDALDGHPVNQVFALVIPEESTEEHLQILASLARVFSDTSVREQLKCCKNPENAINLLKSLEKSAA